MVSVAVDRTPDLEPEKQPDPGYAPISHRTEGLSRNDFPETSPLGVLEGPLRAVGQKVAWIALDLPVAVVSWPFDDERPWANLFRV
jgi:hypothetical protein